MEPDINNEITLSDSHRQRALILILILIASAIIFISGIGKTALVDPDEARYALISQNMIDRGNYLEPYIDGKPYFDKPPLYFWMTAASFKVFGNEPFSARIIPVVGGLLALLSVYLVSEALFGHTVGIIGMGLFSTSLIFIGCSKFVRMDIFLTAFIGLAMWMFIKGYHKRSSGWFVMMYVPIALGILTKGPIALFLPACVIFLFLLWQRDFSIVWSMRLILGLCILIVIAGPWFLYMVITHPTYFDEFFIKQHFSRFGGTTYGHPGSPLIYLATILVGLLPWTGLSIVSICRYVKSAFNKTNPDWSSRILVVWIFFVIIFFSFGHTKLINYILPAFIPMIILLARFFYDYMQSDFPRRRKQLSFAWAYPMSLLAAGSIVFLFFAAGFASLWIHFREYWSGIPPFCASQFWENWGWSICLAYRVGIGIILAKILLYLWRNWQLQQLVAVVGLGMAVLAIDLSYTTIPRVADLLSCRRLAPLVIKNTNIDDTIIAGPNPKWSLQLYLSGAREVTQLHHLADFTPYANYDGKIIYLTTDDDSYNQVKWRMPGRVRILAGYRQTRLLLIKKIPQTKTMQNTKHTGGSETKN